MYHSNMSVYDDLFIVPQCFEPPALQPHHTLLMHEFMHLLLVHQQL